MSNELITKRPDFGNPDSGKPNGSTAKAAAPKVTGGEFSPQGTEEVDASSKAAVSSKADNARAAIAAKGDQLTGPSALAKAGPTGNGSMQNAFSAFGSNDNNVTKLSANATSKSGSTVKLSATTSNESSTAKLTAGTQANEVSAANNIVNAPGNQAVNLSAANDPGNVSPAESISGPGFSALALNENSFTAASNNTLARAGNTASDVYGSNEVQDIIANMPSFMGENSVDGAGKGDDTNNIASEDKGGVAMTVASVSAAVIMYGAEGSNTNGESTIADSVMAVGAESNAAVSAGDLAGASFSGSADAGGAAVVTADAGGGDAGGGEVADSGEA
jgi:hypothetical protein